MTLKQSFRICYDKKNLSSMFSFVCAKCLFYINTCTNILVLGVWLTYIFLFFVNKQNFFCWGDKLAFDPYLNVYATSSLYSAKNQLIGI